MNLQLKKYISLMIVSCIVIFMGIVSQLPAQPSLPTDPARPIPWENTVLILLSCMGCGVFQLLRRSKN